jgi:hypothetical protein
MLSEFKLLTFRLNRNKKDAWHETPKSSSKKCTQLMNIYFETLHQTGRLAGRYTPKDFPQDFQGLSTSEHHQMLTLLSQTIFEFAGKRSSKSMSRFICLLQELGIDLHLQQREDADENVLKYVYFLCKLCNWNVLDALEEDHGLLGNPYAEQRSDSFDETLVNSSESYFTLEDHSSFGNVFDPLSQSSILGEGYATDTFILENRANLFGALQQPAGNSIVKSQTLIIYSPSTGFRSRIFI